MSNRSEKDWKLLGKQAKQKMKSLGVPGVAIGMWYKGEMKTAGLGVTNVEHPLPVTDETLFQIGSITKTFTGTALMRLVERGEVELDATVRTYLPDFKVADEAASAAVTVRHLLTHMGGWEGDFFIDTGDEGEALAKYVSRMAELPQVSSLDTHWSYNNAGFCVLGRIIEKVTGQRYAAAVKELVLEPLGLKHSYFIPADVLTHRFVVGHFGDDGEAAVARPWALPAGAWPAGGLVCSVKDLLAYARFHLGNVTIGDDTDGSETPLLSHGLLKQMQSPQVQVWEQESWGLSWSLDETHGTRLVGHGGGTFGQVTDLTMSQEHDFALAILTNAGGGGQLIHQLKAWVFQEYLDVTISSPEPIKASKEELATYVGLYSRPTSDVEIGMLAGKLIAQWRQKIGFPTEDSPIPPPPPPMSLALCAKDRLVITDGPYKDGTVEMLRRPDGSIGWLRDGRLHVRQD